MSHRKVIARNGYMKFMRLGPIEFGEQSRWSQAPKRKGMWAFPYPFFDMHFAYHKYADIMPKSLVNGTYEAQEEWIEKVGKKILPIREFWYKGDVFSHFYPTGSIGNSGLFDNEAVTWTRTDVSRLSSFISSSSADECTVDFGDGPPIRMKSSLDHLEVFIAPGMGQFRHGKSAPR